MSGWELTTEQQAVVDHPLEPVRVRAGAGTGKTSTIVSRLVRQAFPAFAPDSSDSSTIRAEQQRTEYV